jgi:predicted dehydrogenase
LIGEYSKVEGYSYNTSCKNISNEDNCNVLLRFQNNALGIITVSWCNEPFDVLEIFGTKGMLRIDLQSNDPLSFKPKTLIKNQFVKTFFDQNHAVNRIAQHLLIDHVVQCVINKKQEHPDFNDGKRAVEFVLNAYSKKDSI